jgi:hypothetical protein
MLKYQVKLNSFDYDSIARSIIITSDVNFCGQLVLINVIEVLFSLNLRYIMLLSFKGLVYQG